MNRKLPNRAALAALAILTVLSFLAGFSGCDRIKDAYSKTGSSKSQAVEAPVYAVNTTLAVKGQIQDYLSLSGDILHSSAVDIFSDAAGKVSKLNIAIGSRVRKDDIVAEVDPSRPGMEYVPSPVKSPVTGTVVALPAQLGMTINQAVSLARISGGNGLEIHLYVAERFISKIALNQPCEITVDAYPGEIFRGSIFEISPTLDSVSRTMEIKVDVENRKSLLKAGMFSKVRIITETKEQIVKIPAIAMVNRFGEQFIFVIDNSNPDAPVAKKRAVVPGILIDAVLEIRQGLAPDEEVVIRGQTLIEDGSRVNIVERDASLNAN